MPLMLNGAPVWFISIQKNFNKTLYIRVQLVMNIKIAKAYFTTSNDALYILTGNAPVELKNEEAELLRTGKTNYWTTKQSIKIGHTRLTQ